MTPTSLTRGFVLTRLAVGAAFVLAPGFARRSWLGAGDGGPASSAPLRAMGARDVVLSLGALSAEQRRTEITPWLQAAAVSEAADAVAALAVARHLSPVQRVVAVGGPASLAAVAVLLARRSS